MTTTTMSALRSFLPGKGIHWLVWLAILAVLALLGEWKLHVRDFMTFVSVLLATAAIAVETVIATGRQKASQDEDESGGG